MPGLTLPPFLLSQAVAMTFTDGILFGFYLITVAYANRWLIFADEGWKLRRNVHWFMVIITNLIFAMETANIGVIANAAIAEARFVEQGHRLDEFVDPPWKAIVAVSSPSH